MKCTTSFQSVINSLFDLTIDIETNHFNPDPKSFTNVLQPVQDMMQICTNISIDAIKYGDCITRVETVLPDIGKLITAIDGKDTRDIILDVSSILLELVNGIAYCVGV